MKKLKKYITKGNLLGFLCGAVCALSPMAFDCYPVGIGYIVSQQKASYFALAGCVVGSFLGTRMVPVSIMICVICHCAVWGFTKRYGRVPMLSRLLIAALAGVLDSFEAFGLKSTTKEILLYALATTALAVLSTFVAVKLRTRHKQRPAVKNGLYLIAAFVFARFCTGFSICGVTLLMPMCCYLTLCFAHRGGLLYGIACGCICGFASDAPAVAALGLIGLTYGMFEEDSPLLAAALALMLALPAYGYLADYQNLLEAALALLISSSVFLLTKRFLAKDKAEKCAKSTGLPLSRFAAAFAGVSGVFYTSGDSALATKAEEYNGMAAMLSSAATSCDLSSAGDRQSSQSVSRLLMQMGVRHTGVTVVGRRHKTVTVTGVNMSEVPDSPSEISRLIGEEIGSTLTEPEFVLYGRLADMKLSSKPMLKIEAAQYQRSRAGEGFCGDTYSCFDTGDDSYCCVISDGMGSGEGAAASSKVAVGIAEKLLTAGADSADVIAAINRAIAGRSDEIFATADMLVCDRLTGETLITKSGAPPCYILRGSDCRVIAAATPPLGILPSAETTMQRVKLQKGDCAVMVSDGVYPTCGDDYLPRTLVTAGHGSAQNVLTAILSEIKQSGTAGDDLTICVLRFY